MSLLDDNLIKCIVYKEWTSVDRSTLETVSQPADEFVESFCSKLEALLTHSFITKQQSHKITPWSSRIACQGVSL